MTSSLHTNDWQAHLQVLGELLRRLRKAGLTVKPSKCVFGAESAEFLGHYIGRDWITTNEDHLEKIRTARRPTTKKEVRSFWGLANYYRAHIPTFAAVAAPLTDLTGKGQPNKIYSTLEKERFGIVWGVTKFRLYLAGKPFVLQTDHQPLTYINKTKYQNDCIMRWALALQGYDYTVQDIPGKDNVAADYLSRVMD